MYVCMLLVCDTTINHNTVINRTTCEDKKGDVMSSSGYVGVISAIVRLSLWVALAVIASLDGVRHRHIRSKGWQLFVLLVGDTGLFVVRNAFLLGVSLAGTDSGSSLSRGLQFSYLIFSDLAESAWIFTLLAISSGFCVTRTDFGEHRSVCILIPCIFLLTSLVVDAVLYLNQSAHSIVDVVEKPYDEVDDPSYDPDTDPLLQLDPDTGLIFVFCTLVNSMVFFMAWFYMYDTAKQEWESLKESIQQHEESDDASRLQQAGQRINQGEYDDDDDDDIQVYTRVQERDMDTLKTVEECVSDREKLKIIRWFFIGVSVYMVASVLVFFLPVFLPNIWKATMLTMYDILLLGLMGTLLFVFRMRHSNQFVLLGSDEFATGGDHLYNTELGVM